jgi:MarR family 2-MHQ and catechol resistance regulon transcriptional repressor
MTLKSDFEDFELYKLLHDTATLAGKVRQKELKKYGISTSQCAVLDCVHSSKNVTPTQISRWVLRESQSISMILNRMEKGGLIIRTPSVKRKNVIYLTLTEKGLEVYNLISKRVAIHKMMRELSQEDRDHLKQGLEKFQSIARKHLSKHVS